ncbi:MAG: class II glutamine amidotransferase domain-containing protein [Thermoleophilia bacterium]
MCRLSAITSAEYFSPMENVMALNTMKEGHDGSGLGLVLRDLGGDFKDLKQYPILSGIASSEGLAELDTFMSGLGFREVHFWQPDIDDKAPEPELGRRDHYFAKAYEYPVDMQKRPQAEKEELLLDARLALRELGEEDESIFVFSFYPDTVTLKEVGDPLELGQFFRLDDGKLKARIILAQGRQNTNYDIYLYACHPFFLQGYCTMTNGENTAFVPIMEFLTSRGFPGYMGYNSDSEVFAHILHYTQRQLGYPLTYYKDVITPLAEKEIDGRKDAEALRLIRRSLRPLCIDGPNCVIGFAPDGTVFMVQDAKKLRPGIVGGVPGKYALMSEECGLDEAVPRRDKTEDFSPMKYDMAIIKPGASEMVRWSQLTP